MVDQGFEGAQPYFSPGAATSQKPISSLMERGVIVFPEMFFGEMNCDMQVQGGPCLVGVSDWYVLFGSEGWLRVPAQLHNPTPGKPQVQGCSSFCAKRIITSDASTLELLCTSNETVLVGKVLHLESTR